MRWVAVIPFYNCEDFIGDTISSFGLSHFQVFEKVILIDNASRDSSLARAQHAVASHMLAEKFMVLKNRENYGLGGTFKIAVRTARQKGYSQICFFHGDGQASLKDLPKFAAEFQESPDVAAVLGSRFCKGSQRSNYSWIRILGNWFFNVLFSLFAWRWISDIGSGFNVYKISELDEELLTKLSHHIAFDAELLLTLIDRKKKISFVPIHWSDSGQESTVRNFQVGIQLLVILLRWKLGLAWSHESLALESEEVHP